MTRLAALLTAVALVAAACGSSGSNETAESNEESATETTTADTTGSDTTGSDTEVEASDAGDDSGDSVTTAATLGEPDWGTLEERIIPAFGGMTLGVSGSQIVHYDANFVAVRSAFSPERGASQPQMVIGLIAQFLDGGSIDGIDTFTSSFTGLGTVEPTGETLSIFGMEMEQWSFVAFDLDGETDPVLSPYPRGASGVSGWNPFPLSDLYLAETEGGVLALGWTGTTEEELAEAEAIFDQVAPSVELATEDFASTGTVNARIVASEQGESPPSPVDLPDSWDTPFGGVAVPIDAGTYTTAMLGTPAMFTVGEGWFVQPNFPSFFVLTGPESIGPGDRGVEFRTGVTEIVPVNAEYEPAGDGIDFTDLRALAEDPPPNMVIDVTDVEIAGLPAIQADIEIVPPGNCDGPEVCEYMMFTRYAWPGHSLRAGFYYRIVHMEEGLDEPLTMTMAGQDPAWFDIAGTVIDSLEFESVAG